MGFDLSRVLSDDKHYGAFICKLCDSLVSLDAVVTVACSHPFCRECMAEWASNQINNRLPCACPKCAQTDLAVARKVSSNGNRDGLNIGEIAILVQPLGEAEPLAWEVLKMIQVACLGNGDGCDWTGDYGEWTRHREAHDGNLTWELLVNNQQRTQSANAAEKDTTDIEGPFYPRETSECLPPSRSPNKLNKDLPQREATKQVHRQSKSISDLGYATEEDRLRNGHHSTSSFPAESSDLQQSYGEGDWNISHRSIPTHNRNTSANRILMDTSSQKNHMNQSVISASVADEENTLTMDDETRSGMRAGDSSGKAVERSEKLKKQANAKFNKGDFEGARALYSDGLDVMTSMITVNKEECELVATLFSNRAVTYFREKKFQKCIEDCDKALEYEPTFEKSYIRKWRALMALGSFEEACECLEQAHREIPSSQRVKQELVKAREQRDVLSAVNTMIDGGNLEKAKETIKPLTKESDNIGLLLVAAMADAGLGLTEAALEKVNKALRFNPNHLEALQLRGLVLFLSGDMEKGVRLLQELQHRHPDNREILSKLDQCQTTLSAYSKGRGYSKRNRYKEAVEQFTHAISEAGLPLPSGTALFCLIKLERAEALLLSKHYAEALKDCKEALESQPENAEAWALKAEIYMCLGRATEAKEELAELRQTWGSENLVIEDAYRKANFEVKVRKVDDELLQLINDVEAGVSEKVIIDGRDGSKDHNRAGGMHQSERRYGSSDRRSQMDKRAKSYRTLKASERDRKSERKKGDRRSRASRSATGEGSSRTLNTQTSSRTLNTNATGISSRTLNTRGTNGGSHRAKRTTRKKSSRNLKAEK